MEPTLASLADPRFEGVLGEVERAASLPDLQLALEKLIAAYGLKQVVYHALHIPPVGIRQAALVHTYPEEWVKHYAARRYYDIDPVVQSAQRSIVPIDWAELDRSSKQAKSLFNEAAEAGLGRQGISIPIRGSYGEHAVFTVTSEMKEQEWSRARVLYLRDMQVIATYAHNRILAIKGIVAPDYASRLSRREQECLLWAASGKTIDETAAILSIGSRTVRMFLDSARSKLDCVTKVQAVARAVSLGIIQL